MKKEIKSRSHMYSGDLLKHFRLTSAQPATGRRLTNRRTNAHRRYPIFKKILTETNPLLMGIFDKDSFIITAAKPPYLHSFHIPEAIGISKWPLISSLAHQQGSVNFRAVLHDKDQRRSFISHITTRRFTCSEVHNLMSIVHCQLFTTSGRPRGPC